MAARVIFYTNSSRFVTALDCLVNLTRLAESCTVTLLHKSNIATIKRTFSVSKANVGRNCRDRI